MATRTKRPPEPTTAENEALKVELRQIAAAWRGGADRRNAAFREEWAAKMATERHQPVHVSVLKTAGMR